MPNLNRIRTARVKLIEAHTLFPQGVVEAAGGGGKSVWTNMRDIEAGNYSQQIYHVASQLLAQGTGTAAITIDQIMAVPFFVGANDLNVDRMAFRVTAGGAAGSVARVGIYNSTSESNMRPSSLVVDAGEVDTTVIAVHISTVSVVLSANTLYWFALLCGVASPTVKTLNEDSVHVIAYDDTFPTEAWTSLGKAQAYGALPDPFTADSQLLSIASRLPVIGVRLA